MRRLINNTSAIALGNGEQAQAQATINGAMRGTGADGRCTTITPVLDTSAYASGDLIADTITMGTVCDQNAGDIILDSITIVDEDAQGVKLYIIIASASTSMGTINSAPNISDANARNILGYVPVLTTDYITVSGTKIATVRNIGLHLKSAAASRTLYMAILNDTGTPTYTASGMKVTFGFRQA